MNKNALLSDRLEVKNWGLINKLGTADAAAEVELRQASDVSTNK